MRVSLVAPLVSLGWLTGADEEQVIEGVEPRAHCQVRVDGGAGHPRALLLEAVGNHVARHEARQSQNTEAGYYKHVHRVVDASHALHALQLSFGHGALLKPHK